MNKDKGINTEKKHDLQAQKTTWTPVKNNNAGPSNVNVDNKDHGRDKGKEIIYVDTAIFMVHLGSAKGKEVVAVIDDATTSKGGTRQQSKGTVEIDQRACSSSPHITIRNFFDVLGQQNVENDEEEGVDEHIEMEQPHNTLNKNVDSDKQVEKEHSGVGQDDGFAVLNGLDDINDFSTHVQ